MRRTLVVLATLMFSISPAGAATWQENYKAGKYAEAAEMLKTKLGTAATEYYYADCLYRTKKVTEALDHYEKAYSLEPDGQFAKFSLQVLKAHNRTPSGAGVATGSDGAATGGGAAGTAATGKSGTQKLPDIVRATKETPTLSEIQGWSKDAQANYLSIAQSRLKRAQENLKKASEARNLASAPAMSAPGKDTKKLLGPYDDSIREHSDIVSEASQIVSLCEHARTSK